jgi:hypothetical protein
MIGPPGMPLCHKRQYHYHSRFINNSKDVNGKHNSRGKLWSNNWPMRVTASFAPVAAGWLLTVSSVSIEFYSSCFAWFVGNSFNPFSQYVSQNWRTSQL